METIGEAARRLLAGLERAANARERPSGERPERIEPERDQPGGSDQHSGIRREGQRIGKGCGRVEVFRAPDTCNDAPSRDQRGNTYRYDFTNAGLAVRVQWSGDARWIELRSRPHRPGDGGSSSRLPVACNDDRRHAGTFWRWS